MANAISLITKYMKEAVDTVLTQEAKTSILVNGQKFIDVNFKEAGYVKIASILMDGLSDYKRANNGLGSAGNGYSNFPTNDGYKVGDAQLNWEIVKLDYDRGKQFRVDDMDNEETAGLMIGNLLTEFLRTKVVPEVDAIRFSKMASKCNVALGNLVSESISANQIIGKFNTAFEWLFEHGTDAENQVIFVSPAVMTLIRNTTELTKFITQGDYRNKDTGINFTVEKYGERPIIEVPSNRFFTNAVAGVNGYSVSASSYVINFIVCDIRAVVPVVKLEKSKIWTPEQVQDFDGYKVNFRMYHDIIVPKNKVPAIYCNVSTTSASAKMNVLSVALTKVTNGYTLDAHYTNPYGMLGTVVRSASAFTLGTAYSTSATVVAVEDGDTFTKFASETAQYFALLDGNGVCIAISGSVTLPV